jgi:hypothetical protein
MFKKLDFPTLDLTLEDIRLLPHSTLSPTFSEFNIANKKFVYEQVAKKIKFGITPNYQNISVIQSPGARPHKDAFPVALNYYLTVSGGDRTHFYKTKTPELDQNKDTFVGFRKIDLIETGSYTAEQYEFFLLATKTIHSLTMDPAAPPRYILRFVWWNNTFEEILDSISLASL